MFDITAVVQWLKKKFTAKDFLLFCVLIICYLATRIINLDKFPIFTDEGIYIHWSKIAWHDANWRFISLTDGKQPLHTWGMIPFLKIFSPNLLLGGRAFSVLTGLIALKGVFSLAYYLWGKKAAFVTSFLYVFTPMFMFYDRMALADSAVNAGFIWILFGSILLIRTLRLDVALGLGIISGLALLTKSSSQMFLGLSALAPIIVYQKGKKKFLSSTFNYYVLLALTGFIALAMYNVQRLSPFLQFVAQKNTTFVMSFGEFVKAPFSLILGNLHLIPWYVSAEMSYVATLLGLAGLVMLYRKDRQLALYFALWIILPYIAISTFAKVIFPRYIVFFASTLILTAGYLISQTKNKSLALGYWFVFFASVAYFNYTIVTASDVIPFPPVDRGQYIESANSGYGVKEIIGYAREKAKAFLE